MMSKASPSSPMLMDKELLQSVFNQLEPQLILEVLITPQITERSVLNHLLLLSPDHVLHSLSSSLESQATLVLMRGLPGSGKTTLARILATLTSPKSTEVFSADDFFVDRHGQYTYISSLVSKAHDWCRGRVTRALKERRLHTIIVDNTNIEGWELAPYCELAQMHKYSVLLVEPDTEYRMQPNVLAQKTRHGVPMTKISEMRSKMAANFTLQKDVWPLIQPHKRPRVNDGSKGVDHSQDHSINESQDELKVSANGEKEETRSKMSLNLDFQSLLQCFPDLDASDLYPIFVAADNDVEKAVDLVLLHQTKIHQDSEMSVESSSADSMLTLTLDASFASNLESQFGSVKHNVPSFPGVYDVHVPRALAMLMHSLWRETLNKTVSKDKEGNKERHRQLVLDRVVLENGSRSQSASPFRPQRPEVNNNSAAHKSTDSKTDVIVSQDELRQLRQRRSDLYHKAAEAFKAKQGGVAAYYSEEGRELTQRIQYKEALFRHHKFTSRHPDLSTRLTLDLHGLNVEDALEQVDWFIEAKIEQLVANVAATLRVEVITGRGRGRVFTAVLKHLREEHALSNLTVAPDNQGCVVVVLKKNQYTRPP